MTWLTIWYDIDNDEFCVSSVDNYIIAPMPEFIGSLDECKIYVKNNS